MSLRQENDLHIRIPYNLLRIPEYIRWFDSNAIGSLYRLLSSKIYRRGVSQLRFYKEGAYLTELAKRYDAGLLCCYVSDEEIEDAMLLGDRRIKDLRSKLVDLKLIKTEKFKDGYIYQLGYVVKIKDDEGYEIGEEYEAHWIGKWYTWANTDEKSEQMAAFRYYLAEMLGSDKKKEEVQTELCKIFPEIRKNFSKILDSSGYVKAPPTRIKSPVLTSPIEVNTNESITYVSPQGVDALFDEPVKEEEVDEVAELVSQFAGKLRSRTHYPISNLSKDYRSILSKGADKEPLSDLILSTVHERNRFIGLPLFSKNLDIQHKNPVDGASWLWFALREDVHGALPPTNGKANIYKEVKAAFSNVISSYSLEQVVWTLRQIARTPNARTALTKNHFAITKMMADYSAAYQTHLKDSVQSNAKAEAQLAATKVSTQERSEFLKSASQSLVVSKNEKKDEEDTIEYWEAKISNATKPALIQYYMDKIDEINRRNS